MEPLLKVYRRRRRESNTIESVDRISALPDSILGDILSLLTTEDALATSTLSKRWRFLWRTVYNLDFDIDRYIDRYGVDRDDANKKFVGFVNHVLSHLDAGVLNKLCLVWTPEYFESTSFMLSQVASCIKTWIKTVTSRNVSKISLRLEDCDEFRMPISLFSCDSLQSLWLDFIWLSDSTAFRLPRLESLYLYGVYFESDEDFEKIIRGCPVLNDLSVYLEGDDSNRRLIISSTSLRRIVLHSYDYHKYFKLDVPSLEHLKLKGYMSVDFVQQKLCSLVEVEFDINLGQLEDYDVFEPGFSNSMVDTVNALERAKYVTLSFDVMQALSCDTTSLSADFERLVKLKTSITCRQWSILQHFIQHSNNLEALTIDKFCKDLDDESEHDHSNWTTPVDVPRCLSTSLKKVVLKSYCGFEDEREMIGYILWIRS